MAQNTTQKCLRFVKFIIVIVDLKMNYGKEVSLKKNGTGIGI